MPQPPAGDGTPSIGQMWEKVRQSRFFPIISIVILAVIILGLGFGVVGLIRKFGGGGGPDLGPVKGPEEVSYQLGSAELKLSLLRAAYQDEYEDSKPLAPGRKFVVVDFEIENTGDAASGAFTNDDMRLITADGSIMKPSGWSQGFLNTGVGAKSTKRGKVIFDIDERNAQQPLNLYQIAFGKNYGTRQHYQLSEQSYTAPTPTPQPTPQPTQETTPEATAEGTQE